MSEAGPRTCLETRHIMAKKLWSGRFKKKLHPIAERFTESLSFDNRLFPYDIQGSIAHVRMLSYKKIIPAAAAKRIIKGLSEIKFSSGQEEDIHTYIENHLTRKIGEIAGHLHTGRSRNDQVQLDMRLYIKNEIKNIAQLITTLQKSILNLAEKNKDVIIPGFTHLQHAQPVLLAHHLLAYMNMFQRDKDRLNDLLKRVDILPLGSGALAGSNLPLDRQYLARILGFSVVSSNSIDSVSDRDYLVELLSILAIIGMHLSRLGEELVLWSTKEFNFIDIDESLCTGSSLMPQKKNPDTAELLRAKSGRLNGNLISLLTVLKGLPLSYNRDLQEDKPPVFDSIDTIKASLEIASLLIKGIVVNKKHIYSVIEQDDSCLATDLVEQMVNKGIPFRNAHEEVGKLIKKGMKIKDINAKTSILSKKTIGSTNPKMVARNINRWKRVLKDA